MEYAIYNPHTNELDMSYRSREEAQRVLDERINSNLPIIAPDIKDCSVICLELAEHEENAECIIYPNANSSSIFSSVLEAEDLLTDEILGADETNPLIYTDY